ncbi:hypothetical protein ACFWN1_30960 [Streptomyces sp. NPDC058459]|uniref:hypothetical protein n=1 Tax=Streptomyces sp. NPDC058459 TaxID=3346508 RepID=UPI003664A03F
MNEFRLGLRLLFGSGRGNRIRFLLMAVGGSVGVCCLALVLTVPAILDAHDGRAAARQPVTSARGPADGTLVLQRNDTWGAASFTRVLIAKGAGGTRSAPPGLEELPLQGTVFASPRLHDLLREAPAVKALLPGREAGVIGPAGLAHPDELVMGLVIGAAAFLVSVTGRAVERRAQVTAVTLIGARARTLRAVRCAQVVLPLSLGLIVALVAGELAESSYLITGGGTVRWDLAGVPLLVLAAVGVVALAATGSLPLVGRRINRN